MPATPDHDDDKRRLDPTARRARDHGFRHVRSDPRRGSPARPLATPGPLSVDRRMGGGGATGRGARRRDRRLSRPPRRLGAPAGRVPRPQRRARRADGTAGRVRHAAQRRGHRPVGTARAAPACGTPVLAPRRVHRVPASGADRARTSDDRTVQRRGAGAAQASPAVERRAARRRSHARRPRRVASGDPRSGDQRRRRRLFDPHQRRAAVAEDAPFGRDRGPSRPGGLRQAPAKPRSRRPPAHDADLLRNLEGLRAHVRRHLLRIAEAGHRLRQGARLSRLARPSARQRQPAARSDRHAGRPDEREPADAAPLPSPAGEAAEAVRIRAIRMRTRRWSGFRRRSRSRAAKR